ncbi:LysE family translocator [Phormidium tenue FACHB-886]|nr:LysE family translocator [Phormidium tenue FACHB-886]
MPLPDASTLLVFVLATIAFLLLPGPAVLYVVTRSISQGRLAGVLSALGVETGNLVHVLAAALGLSAVLVSSALAFSIVKYLGAAYLIYLGVQKLLTPEDTPQMVAAQTKLGRTFRQGVLVGALNPKTALFFLAFLPQFVDVSKGGVVIQLVLLGLLFDLLAVVIDCSYALLAGTIGQWLRTNRTFWRSQRYFSGSVYIGLGLSTAFAAGHEQ